MTWFERQAQGRPEAEVAREHARYLRAAGVDHALDSLAGPFGLRRFLVGFAARPAGGGRHQVELTEILSMPLAKGGGPPPADPSGEHQPALARALTRLHANMAVGPAWTHGVVGYTRDSRGRTQLYPLFDEDSEAARLDMLPVPSGPGHPLEQPTYQRLVANWEARMAAVHARSSHVRPDWDQWTVDGDTLSLSYDRVEGIQAEPRWREVRHFPCHALATFFPARERFTWQTSRRPGGGAPFAEGEVVADWAAAHEISLLAAAVVGAAWLFAGEFGEHEELLYVAVFDRG